MIFNLLSTNLFVCHPGLDPGSIDPEINSGWHYT